MSNQNGPNWYPSKQFTHTPEVPGAPAPSAAPSAAGLTQPRTRTTFWSLVAGLGSAALVLLLLLPAGGTDSNPPVCRSTFGYTVPCGSGLAFGGSLIIGLMVGVLAHRALVRRSR